MDKNTGEAFFAIGIHSMELLSQAIEAGADLNSFNRYGKTMLVAVIEEQAWEFEKIPPTVLDDCIKVLAFFPVEEKFPIKAMRLLLEKGVDVNQKNWLSGETALHIAVKNHAPELIKMLIDKGADVNSKDFQGRTALDYCVSIDNIQVAEILLGNGAWVDKNSDRYYEQEMSNKMKSVMDEMGSRMVIN